MLRAPSIALHTLLACIAAGSCTRRPSASGTAAADTVTSTSHPWAGSSAVGPEAEIYRDWMRHLLSKEGRYAETSGARSSDWLPAEQAQWPVHELAALYLPDGATPEVLNIRPEPGLDGEYRVVTAFHSADANNAMRARLVRLTVFALRSQGRWIFANALPRLTRGWRHEAVGPFTYVMEPNYPFDRRRAQLAVAFVDSLATGLGVPRLEHVTYYLTSSSDELYLIIGLDTDDKYGPVGGLGQPINHQLFSGIPAVGEDYRHELAHLVLLPLIMGHPTTYFVSEGVPTWLGGTTGMDFPTAARGLAEALAQTPSVTLDSLLARQGPVSQFYPAGAVFADMAYQQGGTPAVKALFDAGPTPERFRAAAEAIFQRPWALIAAEWRTHALSFLPTRRHLSHQGALSDAP